MKKPQVLHISTAFHVSKVFHELIVNVERHLPLNQIAFCGRKMNDHREISQPEGYTVISKAVVRKSDSLFLKTRTKRQLAALKDSIDLSAVDLVHAHFLFTDGAVALKIFEEFGTAYVISVRNTDTNIYFKYFPHLRGLASKILANAASVIFVSPAHKIKVYHYLNESTIKRLSKKVRIIPNGIDDFWHLNRATPKTKCNDPSCRKVLYVGNIDKNKNVTRLVQILEQVRSSLEQDLTLTVVGPPKDDFPAFSRVIEGKSWINYVGPVYDKPELQTLFSTHDFFAMLSSRETFGLVYIEAMSQGTPVVFTAGQGIDGYFAATEPVGIRYDLKEDIPESLAEKMTEFCNDYAQVSQACLTASKKFSWAEITEQYAEIYATTLHQQL